MHPIERERRLHSAFELLYALKNCGCSQRFVAAYLKVSHATLSHWKRGAEDKTRKTGVPSEEQLARLVALLRYQLASNLNQALVCYDGCGVARREGALMRHALGSVLREATGYYEQRQRGYEELATKTRAYIAQIGLEAAKMMLSPTHMVSLGDEPAPTEAQWAEARAKSDSAAEEALASFEVTEADMDQARRDLEAWLEKQRERAHRKERERIVRESQEERERIRAETQAPAELSPELQEQRERELREERESILRNWQEQRDRLLGRKREQTERGPDET